MEAETGFSRRQQRHQNQAKEAEGAVSMATSRGRVPGGDAAQGKISPGELNDLVRALSLSNDKADFLTSFLRGKCLLMKERNVVSDSCQGSQIPEICCKSVSGKCKDTGCPRLHSKRHFHWQVTADFITWYDFPEAHVLFLENHFCDPENDLILLRKLDDSCPDRALLSLLGYQLWEIGFVYATWENNCAKCPIRSKDSQYYIRRLCSERSQKKIRANRFIWYFQDDSRKWLPFDAGSNNRLEEAHQRDPEGRVKIETGRARYRVDFSKMRQENESTKKQRRIQRRPLPMQGFI
nr:uncharacterized protein LOC113819489 [Penaeus vannamei]